MELLTITGVLDAPEPNAEGRPDDLTTLIQLMRLMKMARIISATLGRAHSDEIGFGRR